MYIYLKLGSHTTDPRNAHISLASTRGKGRVSPSLRKHLRKIEVHLTDQVTQHTPAVHALPAPRAGKARRSHRPTDGIASDHPPLIGPA